MEEELKSWLKEDASNGWREKLTGVGDVVVELGGDGVEVVEDEAGVAFDFFVGGFLWGFGGG